MNQHKIWGILLIVFVLFNGYNLANNVSYVLSGGSGDVYVWIAFEIIMVVALTYILMKYYVPVWQQNDKQRW